jgi:signal transduction histidine kinase
MSGAPRLGRPAGTLRRLLDALALAAALALCGAAAAQVQPLHKLDWRFVAPDPAAPAAGAEAEGGGTPFLLPLHWRTESDTPLRSVALRLHFSLAEVPERPWALLAGHATEGGRYLVNGHAIGIVPAETAWRHVAWRRPLLLAIDPALLQPGDNELLIETSYGAGTHWLAGVEVGPQGELWNRYAVQLFLAYVMNWVGATIALLTAVVFGALWWRQRDPNARLLAFAALAWLALCAAALVEIMPAELRLGVHLAGLGALAVFAALITLLLLRLAELARAPWELLVWLFAAAGPVLSAFTGTRADPYLERTWLPGLVLVIAAATGVGLYRRTQGRAAPQALVQVAAVVLVCAALLDCLGMIGHNDLDGIAALDFAGPFMLVALATPLIDALMKRMHETEAARVELESRVREREQLLKRNYERLRESERVKAGAEERQRIMQDMHDGLGSQLLSSLMLVERGGVSSDQFAQILRESIDDMRLAIDAMAADDADLAAALGNLRFRMEPRFRAAGMELTWDARRLPEELGLHTEIVLPVLRIVQEALTNALKHSRARAVRVTLATEGAGDTQVLDIRIADNGRGIGEERVGGRGLLNMRARAQKIGAQLKVETAVNVGTSVHVRARIGPIQPAAKASQTILNTQAIIERARMQ